jgi:hypothetical protein
MYRGNWLTELMERARQKKEQNEQQKRQTLLDERELRRDGREAQTLLINRGLLYVNFGLFAIAALASSAAFWQAWESHRAAKDAQNNFAITRQDARDSAAQARQDALDTISKQLEASRELRDQAGRSADAATSAAMTAKQTQEVSNRPYLGVLSVGSAEDRANKTMDISAFVKNFGPIPALDVELSSTWYYNDVQVKRLGSPDSTTKQGVIFPGDTRSVSAHFKDVEFANVDAGGYKFWIRVSAHYRGALRAYEYCEDWEYYPPGKNFFTLGTCDRPGARPRK